MNTRQDIILKHKKVELQVGVHIDNKGNFLPKEFAVGSANGKYMNEKYYQLKTSNNAQFKLLRKVKEKYVRHTR